MYITYEHFIHFKNTYISKWMGGSRVNGHIIVESVPMVRRGVGVLIREVKK